MTKPRYKNIVFNVLFAASCLFFVCLLWERAFLLTIVLAIVSAIGLYKWKNRETIILFLISGFWGATAEIIAIYFNVWSYTSSNILGIPYWLPVLWGNAAVFSYQIAIEIKNLKL